MSNVLFFIHMANGWIDDNNIISWVDDNGITSGIDDNGITS